MIRQPPKFKDALEVLARHHVDFIVVGGVAAVLGGAPISTFDLDIVHDRAPTNVARLLSALTDLDARYRDLTGRVLRLEARGLEALIRSKVEANRDKDRAVLPILHRTLEEGGQ